MPNLNMWTSDETSEHNRGRVLGFLTPGINLGMFVSPVLAQFLQMHFRLGGIFAVSSAVLYLTAISFLVFSLLLNRI